MFIANRKRFEKLQDDIVEDLREIRRDLEENPDLDPFIRRDIEDMGFELMESHRECERSIEDAIQQIERLRQIDEEMSELRGEDIGLVIAAVIVILVIIALLST